MKKLNFKLNIAIIKTIQEYRAAFRRLEKEHSRIKKTPGGGNPRP